LIRRPSAELLRDSLEGTEFEEFIRRHAHATLGEMLGLAAGKGSVFKRHVVFARSRAPRLESQKKSWCYKERDEGERTAWAETLKAVAVCARVYVDETGCDDTLQREYGGACVANRVSTDVRVMQVSVFPLSRRDSRTTAWLLL
jgi:hypothetical protein